jgi:hypothetical protein
MSTRLPDSLIRILQVILEDRKLTQWFMQLDSFSENQRLIEMTKLSRTMRRAGMDEESLTSIELLNHPHVWQAAVKTIAASAKREGV